MTFLPFSAASLQPKRRGVWRLLASVARRRQPAHYRDWSHAADAPPGYDLDIERVLALVPTMGVAVEVNGNLLHRVTGSHRREAVVLPTQHSPERPIPDPAAVTSRSP